MTGAIYVIRLSVVIQLFIIVNVLLDITRTEMRKQTKLREEQDEPDPAGGPTC